jgi:hypothetical protein
MKEMTLSKELEINKLLRLIDEYRDDGLSEEEAERLINLINKIEKGE